MNEQEMLKVQGYLQAKLGNTDLVLKKGDAADCYELYAGSEFLGTIYRDDEEGEVSYDLNISILAMDL